MSGGGAGRPSPARADAILDAGRQPEAAGAWYLDMQRHTDTRKRDVAMIAGIVRDPEADA